MEFLENCKEEGRGFRVWDQCRWGYPREDDDVRPLRDLRMGNPASTRGRSILAVQRSTPTDHVKKCLDNARLEMPAALRVQVADCAVL